MHVHSASGKLHPSSFAFFNSPVNLCVFMWSMQTLNLHLKFQFNYDKFQFITVKAHKDKRAIADVQNHGVPLYCKYTHLFTLDVQGFPDYQTPVCPRDGLPYSSLPGFVQQDSSPCLPSGSSLQDAVEDGYLAGTIYPWCSQMLPQATLHGVFLHYVFIQ